VTQAVKAAILSFLARISMAMGDDLLRRALVGLLGRRVKKMAPEAALRFLLAMDNDLYALQGACAVGYGGGVHPKHRLTGYHDFFVSRLREGEKVLDIGCGAGELAWDMAERAKVEVVAMDLDQAKIFEAQRLRPHPRVRYRQGDALEGVPEGRYDVIVLSNVLEHLDGRTVFLRRLGEMTGAARFLIRVPLRDRDWRVPLKMELGLDHRLDPTHVVEYTKEGFLEEVGEAGLEVTGMEIRWGEIWAEARVRGLG